MISERRLARIEAALTPTELVLRWLDEAHAFGDLESYVRSLLAEPAPEPPLDRLTREAEAAARSASRGSRREEVQKEIRVALRETVFRFELINRINVITMEILDREALIDAAVAGQIGMLASEGPAARRSDPRHLERSATWRGLATFRVRELRAAQEARAIVEERYLAGHATLFPATARAWEEQIVRSTSLADLADRLAEHDGLPPGASDMKGSAVRTAELVRDLVETARVTALEKLGEGERAFGIATRWVRQKLAADGRGLTLHDDVQAGTA